LKQRGTQITKEQIQQYEAERILELDKQEIGRPGMLILGLLFSLAGGLIGLLIGWFHWKAHKDTVAGGKIFRFEDKTRSRGKSIFWIGVISFVGWISTAFIV
jgi:hypothetical protein